MPRDYAQMIRGWSTILLERDTSLTLRGQPTVSEWIECTVQARLARGEITQNYADTIRTVTRAHLDLPFRSKTLGRDVSFGGLRLKSVTQALLQEFFDDLAIRKARNAKSGQERSLSPAYIKNVKAYLRSAWAMLQSDEHLSRYYQSLSFNRHMLRLPKRKPSSRPNRAYSPEEVEALIAACKDTHDMAILGLGLTGLRMPGEARGIRWADFFIEDSQRFLRVERQVVHEGGQDVERPRKRLEGGELVILYIPDRIWQMIESVKPYAMKLGAEHVLVPPPRSRNVVCMSAGAVRGRFEAIRDRANITRPGATLYALRHTVASMYMEIGGEEAARRIGGWTTSKVL